MLNPAKVKFIGNGNNYKLGCKESQFMYCRDCDKKDCGMVTKNRFVFGTIYNAYYLEYWQGKRNSLHVKGEDGVIDYYIPLSDFEIVSDEDNVLNNYEAVVKCVVHDYDNELFELNYGKEYKAIGVNNQGLYLVLDESYDCYFYPSTAFDIVNDTHNILNKEKHYPIYDWNLFAE